MNQRHSRKSARASVKSRLRVLFKLKFRTRSIKLTALRHFSRLWIFLSMVQTLITKTFFKRRRRLNLKNKSK